MCNIRDSGCSKCLFFSDDICGCHGRTYHIALTNCVSYKGQTADIHKCHKQIKLTCIMHKETNIPLCNSSLLRHKYEIYYSEK